MKLIKLKEDHYVVVDDSEIKEGDYYLFTWGGKQEIQRFSKEQYADRENHKHLYANACKKITHSTQPFNFDFIEPLVLSEVKELFGEVDAEKKAFGLYGGGEDYKTMDAFIDGYNQALEDNKDKKYTNEDMLTIRNQLVTMLPVGDVSAWDMIQAVSKYTKWLDEYIQSLQPKTEWEVELIDNKLTLKNQTT